MKITAIFQGRNGSLGYENGKRYGLTLANAKGMSVQREDGTGLCPYQSLSAFLNNWSDIQATA